MYKIEGMHEAFRESKQVFLTTTSKEGISKTRAMTNYNDSPYKSMWYPSFKDTQKVKDIDDNPEVVISFPGNEKGKWYRVKGIAKLATWEEVQESWKWWYLEWVPEEDRGKYELKHDGPFTDRTIIWIDPLEAELGENK
ncbi:MAG: pyridoxamine 5'-phosphate oxidase family protein [Candidatus Thorarchaeota archaeon]|jgi:general stress protein 26